MSTIAGVPRVKRASSRGWLVAIHVVRSLTDWPPWPLPAVSYTHLTLPTNREV